MMAKKRDDGQASRHVGIAGGGRAAVHEPREERMLVAVQHVVVDEPEHVENRKQADEIRAENEEEER